MLEHFQIQRFFVLFILWVSWTEPILPIRRIRKLCRAPETPGGPLAPKDVLILVSFWSLERGYENMNDHLFKWGALSPSLRKNMSNYVM